MTESAFAASRGLFEQVATDFTLSNAAVLTHSGLEDLLAARMREVTRQLFQDHLDLRAVRERRADPVFDAAGVERTRIERGRTRILATVFGKVAVTRIAYRTTGSADLHLADAALNMPTGMHSLGPAKLAATESARGSFAEAVNRVNALTGAGIGHRQVQELAVAAAARNGNKMPSGLAPGERNGRKRMATLGTVYDTEPAVRGVDDIIADPADPADPVTERRPGPKARSKWLCGSVNDTGERGANQAHAEAPNAEGVTKVSAGPQGQHGAIAQSAGTGDAPGRCQPPVLLWQMTGRAGVRPPRRWR
ncbi:hypothetical protein ACWC0A_23645 [Streptomyces scopuliridis]